MTRTLLYSEAIREALDQAMQADKRVYTIGLGVPDPKGVFGTTLGLAEKFGPKRVMDMPTSENAMTGIILGSALTGMRPVLSHQRVDFALLSLDQIINNAAKWHAMFGGKMQAPVVIRLVIGQGWGQGPQHSQSLHALFTHIPGLKVVIPSTPYDAKGLLLASIDDNNPVIFLEHRWLHETFGPVPEEAYRCPLGQSKIVHPGKDITVVSTGHLTIEALQAASVLKNTYNIELEVLDTRTLKPFDETSFSQSLGKTGRLIVADADWKTLGFGAEILALAVEKHLHQLKASPVRVAFPDLPAPTTPVLAKDFFPRAIAIINAALKIWGLPSTTEAELGIEPQSFDQPNAAFRGPF